MTSKVQLEEQNHDDNVDDNEQNHDNIVDDNVPNLHPNTQTNHHVIIRLVKNHNATNKSIKQKQK
jgi:hypothetical protein